MNIRLFPCLLIFLFSHFANAQDDTDSILKAPPNLEKPNILALHPYGIFISRIQGQFNNSAVTKINCNFSLESANVWAAPITTYIPTDQTIRNEVRDYEYHETEFVFDPNSFDHRKLSIANDGIIKSLRVQVIFPLSERSEFHLSARSFLLTKGKAPFTLVTGDHFVEWFHTKIAGGNDPFARELFGLDKAKIYYNDLNNNEMTIDHGDFFIGGLEAAYYFYPKKLANQKRKIASNIGLHLGTNLSNYNQSIDVGISTNIMKAYHLDQTSWLQFAAGLGVLRKNFIDLYKDNMEFGNNNFLANFEALSSFSFLSKGHTRHSFSLDFYLQTSFNKKDEFEYSIPVRSGVSEKSWVT